MDQRSVENSNLPSDLTPGDQADLDGVRRNWRVVEDSGLAQVLQQNEFSQHFDQNRTERRTMQVDTRLVREEQKLEDQFAEEYRAQLRLDAEKEDERMAMELQRQLELEDETSKREMLAQDEELARRIQASYGTGAIPNAQFAMKFNFPPIVPTPVKDLVQRAHDHSTPLDLPANLNFNQLEAIYNVVKEYNARLASEVKDHEIALRLSKRSGSNQALSDDRIQHRVDLPQIQGGEVTSVVINDIQRTEQNFTTIHMQRTEQNFTTIQSLPSALVQEEVDLIRFDDEKVTGSNAQVSDVNPFLKRNEHVPLSTNFVSAGVSSQPSGNDTPPPSYSALRTNQTTTLPSSYAPQHTRPLYGVGRGQISGGSMANHSTPGAAYGNGPRHGNPGGGRSPSDASNGTTSTGATSSPISYVNSSGVTVIPRSAIQ